MQSSNIKKIYAAFENYIFKHKYCFYSYNLVEKIFYTADFIKNVFSVYTHSMSTIYLFLSAQVAKSTFFMKSPVPTYTYIILKCRVYFLYISTLHICRFLNHSIFGLTTYFKFFAYLNFWIIEKFYYWILPFTFSAFLHIFDI